MFKPLSKQELDKKRFEISLYSDPMPHVLLATVDYLRGANDKLIEQLERFTNEVPIFKHKDGYVCGYCLKLWKNIHSDQRHEEDCIVITSRKLISNIKADVLPEAKRCLVCGNEVDWDIVIDEFNWMLENVDYLGVECLTEDQQAVYEGRVCSLSCYHDWRALDR